MSHSYQVVSHMRPTNAEINGIEPKFDTAKWMTGDGSKRRGRQHRIRMCIEYDRLPSFAVCLHATIVSSPSSPMRHTFFKRIYINWCVFNARIVYSMASRCTAPDHNGGDGGNSDTNTQWFWLIESKISASTNRLCTLAATRTGRERDNTNTHMCSTWILVYHGSVSRRVSN